MVAVVTQPDKPVGRHQDTLQPSQVKQYAVEHGLPVLQPVKMKDPDFVEQLRSYQADLQVVVAFRMLPEVVWAMPKYGTFNVHAALLPQYRGAAPINWAVINGENLSRLRKSSRILAASTSTSLPSRCMISSAVFLHTLVHGLKLRRRRQ